MTFSKIFTNPVGRLRSGWRAAIFVLGFIAAIILITTILRIAYAVFHNAVPALPYAAAIEDLISRVALVIAALGVGYLCARFLEALPWRSLGLTLHAGWFRDFLIGSLVGIVSLAIAVLIAVVGGGIRLGLTTSPAAALSKSLFGTLIIFVVAALAEEAMFRSYLLQTLTRSKLAWLGILLTSLPFATIHLGNPNVVPFVTFANTAIAGVWLAVAYLRTRSLWLPLGVHWAWNWALGSLFGLPVSGMRIGSHSLLVGTDIGPAWLSGGSYGIEGGAACTVALILSTLFLWRAPWLTATPELMKMTSEENPVVHERAISVVPAAETIEPEFNR
ncbi:MAG TPA: CPBP family intramembrane glutamic endopeptidase [Pyrinomonadaceae bacterium]|nr:CPBP family intramembrane glutamic endopeptidase [Pyrinomonadaceae bacterium]